MDNLILGKRLTLIREVAGMIFGIVFVLTGGYSGLEFALGCVLTAVTAILKFSVVLGIAVIVALAIAEAWFFLRDVKSISVHSITIEVL